MIEETQSGIVTTFVYLFPQCIILLGCIFYLSKKISFEGILVLLGTLGAMTIITFNQLVFPNMAQNPDLDYKTVFMITGGASFFSALFFAVGFILIILKKTNKHTKLE